MSVQRNSHLNSRAATLTWDVSPDDRLKTLTGEFDLIFVDANKDGYATYVQTILDQKLLSARGIILCDNGKQAFRTRTPVHIPGPPVYSSRIGSSDPSIRYSFRSRLECRG